MNNWLNKQMDGRARAGLPYRSVPISEWRKKEGNTRHTDHCRQDASADADQSGESLRWTMDSTWPQTLSPKIPVNHQGEESNFIAGETWSFHLSQVTKLASPVTDTDIIHFMTGDLRGHHSVLLTKSVTLHPIRRHQHRLQRGAFYR